MADMRRETSAYARILARELRRGGTGKRSILRISLSLTDCSILLSFLSSPLLLFRNAFYTLVVGNRFAYRCAPRIVFNLFSARFHRVDSSSNSNSTHMTFIPLLSTVLFLNRALF